MLKDFSFRTLQAGFLSSILSMLFAVGCAEQKFQEGAVAVTTTPPRAEVSVLPSLDATQPLFSTPDRVMATFPAFQLKGESLHFELNATEMATKFTLEDKLRPIEERRTQISRRVFTETFTQGYPPFEVLDSFDQKGKKGDVDILIVIDDSVSMTEEQQNMSTKMNELLAYLKETNWQIGIVTTSPRLLDGEPQCDIKIVKSSDPDPAKAFERAILAGTSGNRNEYGILQAVLGLKCSSTPWIRPSATLAVLIVSDEDNCSDGRGCVGEAGDQETYLIDYVERDMGRVIGKNAGFYGIFSPPAQPCRTSVNAGEQYQRLVNYKSQGLSNYGNICDASYKTTLNRISENIATLLASEFYLEQDPLPDTLSLKLMDAEGVARDVEPGTYTLSGRAVQFFAGHEPPNGAKLEARYTIAGTPMFQKITLAQRPADSSVSIAVDGAPLDENSYRVEGETLSFDSPPPPRANLSISYRENQVLSQRFPLTQLPLTESLEVKVGGSLVSGYSFDRATGELYFERAPLDGEELSFSYVYREGPLLAYALPLAEGSGNFQIFDGMQPVDFSVAAGVFTIPEAVHEKGKVLTLRYASPDWSSQSIALAHAPLPDSVNVESETDVCGLGKGISLAGEVLVVSCGVSSEVDFMVSYQYREPQREFALSGISDPEHGIWEVFANGKAIESFERDGSRVRLTYDPEDEIFITLQYTWSR